MNKTTRGLRKYSKKLNGAFRCVHVLVRGTYLATALAACPVAAPSLVRKSYHAEATYYCPAKRLVPLTLIILALFKIRTNYSSRNGPVGNNTALLHNPAR